MIKIIFQSENIFIYLMKEYFSVQFRLTLKFESSHEIFRVLFHQTNCHFSKIKMKININGKQSLYAYQKHDPLCLVLRRGYRNRLRKIQRNS